MEGDMWKAIKSLLPPSVPRHSENEKECMRRKAVSLVSTGNILVHFDRFTTEDQYEAIKNQVLLPGK